MATSKRPRKTAKRPPKKKPGKKGALVHFTATQKGTGRLGSDGGTWIQFKNPSWLKYGKRGVNKKIKRAAVKALKKFKKG